MDFHEKTARGFGLKAIDAWVRYSKTEFIGDKEDAEWFERAADKHRKAMQEQKKESGCR